MNVRIFPPETMINARIKLPLSKSICNRLLIINALTRDADPLPTLAEADDSKLLADAIEQLRRGASEVNVGAAGTAMRFITALGACSNQLTPAGTTTVIDGNERMRQRPIGPLVDSLRTLGAEIEYLGQEGFPPLKVTSRELSGGKLSVDASISSQFISALMMVAPTMRTGLHIHLEGETASRPYIAMTEALMQRAGINVDFTRDDIIIEPGSYRPCDYSIEPDWSAASYWYSVDALTAGFVTLVDLQLPSIQGDSRCAELFEMLGVITQPTDPEDEFEEGEVPVDGLVVCPTPEQYSRFEVDLSENPDIAQTLAVTSAMLGIPFHLRGLSTLKIKETDRLEAMRVELDKLGFIVEIRANSELVWNGERHPIFQLPRINTYGDHRMAMAFAPASVYIPGLEIADAEVVAKSYPSFWEDLESAGFTITDADIPMEYNQDGTPLLPDTGNEPSSSNTFGSL